MAARSLQSRRRGFGEIGDFAWRCEMPSFLRPMTPMPFPMPATKTVGDLAAMLLADCSEYAHHQNVVVPLQNGPGNVTLESETDEEAAMGKLLAIDDFAAHRRFSLQRSNLRFFARLPRTSSADASAARTDVVGISSFAFFGALRPYGLESHGDHHWESFFFPAGFVPKHALPALRWSGSTQD